jgi:hypothetical protein
MGKRNHTEEDMANRTKGRVLVNKAKYSRLQDIASQLDRGVERQCGIILERVADLIESRPELVKELRLLDPELPFSFAA